MKKVLIFFVIFLIGCEDSYDNPYQKERRALAKADYLAGMRTLEHTKSQSDAFFEKVKTLENGQTYIGMSNKEFLEIWGPPKETQDLGNNLLLMKYYFDGRIGVRSFRTSEYGFFFENGFLTNWSKD